MEAVAEVLEVIVLLMIAVVIVGVLVVWVVVVAVFAVFIFVLEDGLAWEGVMGIGSEMIVTFVLMVMLLTLKVLSDGGGRHGIGCGDPVVYCGGVGCPCGGSGVLQVSFGDGDCDGICRGDVCDDHAGGDGGDNFMTFSFYTSFILVVPFLKSG